jgi:hypothetical protein
MALERYSDNLDSRQRMKDSKDYVAKTIVSLKKKHVISIEGHEPQL